MWMPRPLAPRSCCSSSWAPKHRASFGGSRRASFRGSGRARFRASFGGSRCQTLARLKANQLTVWDHSFERHWGYFCADTPTVATAGAATAVAATTAFATPTLAATTITGGHTYLG